MKHVIKVIQYRNGSIIYKSLHQNFNFLPSVSRSNSTSTIRPYSSSRSSLKVRERFNQLVKNNVDYFNYFCTYTFNRDINDISFYTDYTNVQRYVSKKCKNEGLHCIFVLEQHTKLEKNNLHAYHIHMLCDKPLNWKRGFFKADKIKNHDNDLNRSINYLKKYITKSIDDVPHHHHYFFSNIKPPKKYEIFDDNLLYDATDIAIYENYRKYLIYSNFK